MYLVFLYMQLFWEIYEKTIAELIEKKETLYTVIDRYYKNGDGLRFKAYVNRVLTNPATYITKQKKGYNAAYKVFEKWFKYKKKLEKKAKENPAFVQAHPLIKMYHDSNQYRLTAFFLVEYHHRDKEIVNFL